VSLFSPYSKCEQCGVDMDTDELVSGRCAGCLFESEQALASENEDLRAKVKELECTREECERQFQQKVNEVLLQMDRAEKTERERDALRAKVKELEKERDAYAAAAHVYFDDEEAPKDATIERYKKALDAIRDHPDHAMTAEAAYLMRNIADNALKGGEK